MSFALSELLAVIKLSFIFIAPAPLPTVKRPLVVTVPKELLPKLLELPDAVIPVSYTHLRAHET